MKIQNLTYFNTDNFFTAGEKLFKELDIPLNPETKEPIPIENILGEYFKPGEDIFKAVENAYYFGFVDDEIFNNSDEKTKLRETLKDDRKGILIFGVKINWEPDKTPSRTNLLKIARAFNRVSIDKAVIVLFQYGHHISIATTERLEYKINRKGEKIGKLFILKDIDTRENKTHSAHLRILNDLALWKSEQDEATLFYSFSQLFERWQKVFDIEELNNNFYKEIANWYFWAVQNVKFPTDNFKLKYGKEKTKADLQDEANQIAVIRLLTRLIFVWFIKEKGLVPRELFNKTFLDENHLQNTDKNKSTYYKAILQNLFFATLNLEMNSDRRTFSKQDNSTYLEPRYRYKNLFKNPEKALKDLFSEIPFLNGGLFDNLDKRKENNKGEIRIDWFSDNKKNSLEVPDFLFFAGKTKVDLNETYDTKGKKYYAHGLIHILEQYKFTIEENTPLEIEIALDPELLGKVFENLLAYYNPETGKTARKKTGSFYTPRPIVEYMTDESLKAHLKTALTDNDLSGFQNLTGLNEDQLNQKLTDLVDYNEHQNPFTLEETVPLIAALDNIKVLDPACGSGAFPMGVLHKMVYILGKLDPENELWKEQQKRRVIGEKLDELQKDKNLLKALSDEQLRKKAEQDADARIKEIEEEFNKEYSNDYYRKLYIIQNSIFGIDIQPIAVQISKLRFFLSLIIEQNVNWKDDKNNYGLKPLPNLETKFVAANTLIKNDLFENKLTFTPEITTLSEELKNVRQQHFFAKNRAEKRDIHKEDKKVRELLKAEILKEYKNYEKGIQQEIEELNKEIIKAEQGIKKLPQARKAKYEKNLKTKKTKLTDKENLIHTGDEIKHTANSYANWNPYDQNASAGFFDMEWMFGINDKFDIVIGNPPYIKEYTDKKAFVKIKGKKYYQGKMDIWYYFTCVGIDQLNPNGNLSFIAPNNWTTNAGASIMRNKIVNETNIEQLIDFGSYMIFENAAIQTMIFLLKKKNLEKYIFDFRKIEKSNATIEDVGKILHKKGEFIFEDIEFEPDKWKDKNLNFENKEIENILEIIKSKTNFIFDARKEVAQGIVPPQDFLNKSNKLKLGSKFSIGEGIFILSSKEFESLNTSEQETEIIKPFYTTNELSRYYGNKNNNLWVIYTDSSFKNSRKIHSYPNIKKHLDRFTSIITSDNKPYGLHRARNEFFFKDEKIISLRKCARPTFTYTDFDCYVSQTFFVIKSNRINQKYLTAILNSRLIAFWLWHRGKLQGDFYQVDKEPILKIPIRNLPNLHELFSIIFDYILHLKKQKGALKSHYFEQIIDGMVYELYFEKELKEAGKDILQFLQDLPAITDEMSGIEKEQIINKVYNELNDAEHPVKKRLYYMDSIPEIRIIEGKEVH